MWAKTYKQFIRYGIAAVESKYPEARIFKRLLRARFRASKVPSPSQVSNTLQFLKAASLSNGLERRCLKTMIHVEASRYAHSKQLSAHPSKVDSDVMRFNDEFYHNIIKGINKSQDMCL